MHSKKFTVIVAELQNSDISIQTAKNEILRLLKKETKKSLTHYIHGGVLIEILKQIQRAEITPEAAKVLIDKHLKDVLLKIAALPKIIDTKISERL